jgi:hypothetical protein
MTTAGELIALLARVPEETPVAVWVDGAGLLVVNSIKYMESTDTALLYQNTNPQEEDFSWNSNGVHDIVPIKYLSNLNLQE